MRDLIAAEAFKIRKRRLPWILGVCIVGIISMLYLILLIALSTAPGEEEFTIELTNGLRLENTIRFGDGIVYRVVALLSLILSAVVIADEYHWRTIVMRVGFTGERVRPFLASMIVIAAIATVGLFIGYATTIVATIVMGAARGTLEMSEMGPWLIRDTVIAVVRTLPAILVFICAAAAIAAWARSSAAGIAVPLGVLFLEPIGAAALAAAGGLDRLSPMMLTRNVDSLLAANGEVIGTTTQLPEGLPSAWLAAVFLIGYAVFTTTMAARLVSRREIAE